MKDGIVLSTFPGNQIYPKGNQISGAPVDHSRTARLIKVSRTVFVRFRKKVICRKELKILNSRSDKYVSSNTHKEYVTSVSNKWLSS